MPTVVLFFQENGLELFDIMLIQAIYSVTIALLEIPSGYAADVFGRKNSMIVGTFFGLAGIIIYAFSFGFFCFLPAALCMGIGQSFVSGSDTALMYDSLLELKREKDFIKLEGRTISMGNFAEAVAFVIGGFLAEITLRTPFYYQIGIAAIGFFTALLLIEPKVYKLSDGKKKPWKNIRNIIRFALKENKTLRYFILYSSIIGAATLTMAWFVQPYYKLLDINVIYFGIIGAVLNIAVAIPSFYAHIIEEKIKTRYLLIFFLTALSICYFLVSQFVTLWSLVLLLIFYIVRGIATPVLRDYMNRHTPSEMRATIMSIRSFIIRIVFASISPLLGYVADVYTLPQALLFSGILFLCLGGTTLIFLLQNSKKSY
ncbi:MAG: MFS transporter [Vicingaceae bacterium]|nr:MFS transporter [Vicingaceae bacterium]